MDRQGRDHSITFTTTAHISATQMETRFACAVIMHPNRRLTLMRGACHDVVAISRKLGRRSGSGPTATCCAGHSRAAVGGTADLS